MEELTKRNNSNNPSEEQPIKPDGTYTYKNGGSASSNDLPPSSAMKLKLGEISDDDLLDFLEDDKQETKPQEELKKEEPKSEKGVFNAKEAFSFFNISQSEAAAKAREIESKLRQQGIIVKLSSSDFVDKRTRLASALALQKASEDFPLNSEGAQMGELTYKTSHNNYYGDTRPNLSYNPSMGCYELNANWLYLSKGSIRSSYSHASPAGSTAEEFLSSYLRNCLSNFHDRFDSEQEILCSVAFHEYGHNVQYALYNSLVRQGKIVGMGKGTGIFSREEYRRAMTDIKKLVIAKAKEMFPEIPEYKLENDVSEYGKKNSREWFAETFTSMYSNTPRKVALAMREFLKENYK